MSRFLSVLDFFTKKREQKALRGEDERELFVRKYRALRAILNKNNEVLLAMGDMQEKAGGAYVFDRAYVESSYQKVSQGIKEIIDKLNVLSDGRYDSLNTPYQRIDAAVRSRFAPKLTIPETDYVLPLKRLNRDRLAEAGGKFAQLGEIAGVLELPVPPGFVISTTAYLAFLAANRIQDAVKEKLRRLDIRNFEELTRRSSEIQQLVTESQVPAPLAQAILTAYEEIRKESGDPNLRVAVRSSALHEDIRASFAGQFETALNVGPDTLLREYKRVLASQFTPRALFYFREKDFDPEQMAMAVGVLAMVDSQVSGIMYTRDPGNPQEGSALVNAVCGLGPYAVGGVVPSDNYSISGGEVGRAAQGAIHQQVMLVSRPEGGTQEIEVPPEKRGERCLSHEQLLYLADLGRRLEAHFAQPQDVEWAVDAKGRFFLLQSRPLRIAPRETSTEQRRPRVVKGYNVLLDKGTIASRGVAAGPVHVVLKDEDFAGFPDGAVLVTKHSYPELAVLLSRASAIVSDIGTVLGHLATVAREYRLPALFNTGNATKVLKTGMQVTVDAVYATVYEGIVKEIVSDKKTDGVFEKSAVLYQLREILGMITPLTMTDPRSVRFTPNHCKTLHDITRFAHEVSMRVIFDLAKESHFAGRSSKRLVSEGVPLQWWIVDLEDGIKAGVWGKKVKPEEIVSIPMRALWDGMTALPWKGPPPVDSKGFLSVVFSSTTDPSIDPAVSKHFAEKNYIMVSRNFCNVSTRLGFHFSTIEAFVGEQENQNYITFAYTGGGAEQDRKHRRAVLISRLLYEFDFRVDVKGEALFARVEGYERAFLEDRLRVLGHIIVHTRQMDMVMHNDAMVDWYFKELLKETRSIVRVPLVS